MARLSLGLLLLALVAGPPSAVAAVEIEIEIVGVGGELAQQIRSHLGTPASAEPAAVAAFRRRAPERARQGLEAVGYYRAEVEVLRRESSDGLLLVVRVDPGEPIQIRRIEVSFFGDAAEDPVFADLLTRLPIREGDVLHHGRYEAARRMIQSVALDRGYFDGRFTARRVEVDTVSGSAEVILHYHSGVRYRFGAVHFSDSPLADAFLQRLVPFERGEPYTAQAISAFNRGLLGGGYFRDVRVRPQRDAAADDEVPVDVHLTARARHEFTTGVGYSTDLGPRLRFGWRRPWVNAYGHSFAVDSELAERRQIVSSTYTVPLKDPLRTSLEYRFGVQSQEIADIDTDQVTFSVQHRHQLDSGWQQVLSTRADWERFRIDGEERATMLYLPGGSWSRLRSRGGLDPSWGDRQRLSIEAADTALFSDVDLIRVLAGTRWVRTLGQRNRFLFRADLGALTTNSFADVPPSLRFFAGGDQSVRGYRYQTLGPREDGTKVGGRYLGVASVEYGYQMTPNWRPALFVDVGNAVADWGGWSEEAKIGAGPGIRWASPVGPIRLDLAFTLGERESDWRLHFSMGSDL